MVYGQMQGMWGVRTGLVLRGVKDLLHCNAKRKQQVMCFTQQGLIYCTHQLWLPVIHVHAGLLEVCSVLLQALPAPQ